MYVVTMCHLLRTCYRISLSKVESDSFITGNLDSERQTELDIKCLQILRATIYNRIVLIDEEDKERDPKKYRRYMYRIVRID